MQKEAREDVASSVPVGGRPCDPDSTLETRSSTTSSENAGGDDAAIKRAIRLGRHLLKNDEPQETLSLIAELLQKYPRNAELVLLQGECLRAQGHLTQAAVCFARLQAFEPENVEALMQLAGIHHSHGELNACLEVVQQAIRLQPERQELKVALAAAFTDLGTALKNQGKRDAANGRYWEALSVQPDFAPALYNLGVCFAESSQVDQAMEQYKKAVEADPCHGMAWGNLAALCLNLRRFEESLRYHREALTLLSNDTQLRKSYARLLTILGAQSKDAGKMKEATNYYEEALLSHPGCVEAMYNLAIVLSETGERGKAIFLYETAIHYNGRLPELHNNLGVVYKDLGMEEKALQCYQAALAIDPNFAMSLSNAGLIFAMKGHAEDAMEHISAAIRANPQYFEAYNNLGVVQKDVGLNKESLESYQRCLEICPDCRSAENNYLLGLNYTTCGSCPKVSRHHLDWGEALSGRLPRLPPIHPRDRDLDPERVLKVGYVSGDLCVHSVSYFAEAPLTEHRPDRVQLFVYSCTPRADEKTKLLQEKVACSRGTWKDIAHLSERDLAELIRVDGIDILVELSGHTSHNRLGTLAMKPAPIQVTWIGYPNSTGLKQIDYRLTDEHCDPVDTRQIFAEELVRLPHCFLCYTPIADPPPVSPAPCLENGYVTFGSFNNLAKITDDVIQTWCEILKAVPESRLILKNKTFACQTNRERFRQRFGREGIASWRLDFLPLSVQTKDHLIQYTLMDISLDPWPYAGTTTTCESLFMGVPCLTLAGDCHAHNVGVSLLRTVGLDPGWIATSVEAYRREAIERASDFERLAKLRAHLRVQMLSSELCNAQGHIHRLETEYREMWKRWIETELLATDVT